MSLCTVTVTSIPTSVIIRVLSSHLAAALCSPFLHSRWAVHRQEVCGLTWSKTEATDSALLGSGGNDNKVSVWDIHGSARVQALDAVEAPLFKFHEHTAAVRGMAWDPHVANVLATGGGTQDTMIRFWNTQTGSLLHELDTGSQVNRMVS
jgi:cell division cycle 20-like protein 1, cofactor of APC complex